MNPEVKKGLIWGGVALALILVADMSLHLIGTFVKPSITDKTKVGG